MFAPSTETAVEFTTDLQSFTKCCRIEWHFVLEKPDIQGDPFVAPDQFEGYEIPRAFVLWSVLFASLETSQKDERPGCPGRSRSDIDLRLAQAVQGNGSGQPWKK
ncbi:MAG: hypothetical protein ACK5Q8_04515 [Phycisphaerales bacterium]|jgi:hypothetical protein